MSLSAEQKRLAMVAFQRFGLGPKPGLLAGVASNAKGAVLRELEQAGIADLAGRNLPSYDRACRIASFGYEKAEEQRRTEMSARIRKHLSVRIGFVERLVLFWSNHFSMAVDKSETIRGTIGQVERQVIRRHALGSFPRMLEGVVRHPAMIAYLDNTDSIGPNSEIGKSWGVGFNENLAREVLELYTVGSGAGYTEADVTELSLALTGWSYVRGWEAEGRYNGGNDRNRGRYLYRRTWHEPGVRTVMGKRYGGGESQALAILKDLALHPRTAEHIAFKLVRHFITDEPTPAMVDPIAKAYVRTNGNLMAVAKALLDLPEAWSAPLEKIRQPYELQIGLIRALGMTYRPKEDWAFVEVLKFLNQNPWNCPSPQGFSDETPTWLAPDAMTIRLDSAQLAAWVFDDRRIPPAATLAKRIYGPALSRESLATIEAEPHEACAYTTFLMTPEFQRR